MRWVVIICSLSIVPVVPNKTTVIMPHCLSIGLILILGCEALSLNFVLKWIHFHFDYCRLCHALFFFFLHTCRFISPQIKTSQLATFWWLVMWVKPLSLPLSSTARSQKENTHLIMTHQHHPAPYCDQNRETQRAFDRNLKSWWPRCSASSVHDILRLKTLKQKAPHSVKEGQNIPTRTKNIDWNTSVD